MASADTSASSIWAAGWTSKSDAPSSCVCSRHCPVTLDGDMLAFRDRGLMEKVTWADLGLGDQDKKADASKPKPE